MKQVGKTDDRIFILGGKGMLGTDLSKACQKYGFNATVLDLPQFDITNSDMVKQAVKQADIVINCAAYTNVDKAESESELAYKINAKAVGNLGRIAKKTGVYVLHISTDFVFDGTGSKPYTETDITNPLNAYGKSKLAGEELLIESGCESCIIRVEWTYGSNGNNFIKKLVSLSQQRKDLKVVDDQIGSPTATVEVSEAICELLSGRPQGLFHFASDGYVSRYEMARFVFEKLEIDVNLSACKSSEFQSAAERPLNSCFDCSKIKKLLAEPIRRWQEPLEEFLREL